MLDAIAGGRTAIRSGPIHVFAGGLPEGRVAAFSASPAVDLPVSVFSGGQAIAEGRLVRAEVSGDSLVGTIAWPQEIEDRVADGGTPAAHCLWGDDGGLIGVAVDLDDDGPEDDEDEGEDEGEEAESCHDGCSCEDCRAGVAGFSAANDARPFVQFSTVIPTSHRRTEDGFNIYPDAILFEVGDYADKGFSMSESEAALAVSRFASPVGGNIEHTNFMRGRACQVRSLRIDPANPRIIRGEVALPATFDDHLIDEERRVSCEWDRVTKELKGLALTVNPRVKKAALVAAFAANEATADDVAAFAGEPDADPEIIAAFATPRKHDPELSGHMQAIHDTLAANHPWVCGGTGQIAAFGDKPKQFKAIKALHDQTTEHGATCPGNGKSKAAPFSGRSPMSKVAITNKRSILARLFGGNVAEFNEILPDDESGETKSGKILSILTEDGAVATGDEIVTDLAQKVAESAPAAFADSPEYKALVAANEALKAQVEANAKDAEARRVKDIQSAAATFATKAIQAHKADSVEYDDLVEQYVEAAQADHEKGGTVTFSKVGGEAGEKVEGSRVARFSAIIERRPSRPGFEPSGMSGRPLREGETALFSHGTTTDLLAIARAQNDAHFNPAGVTTNAAK